MKKYEIHPFYFPTTAFFVDDSAGFLTNLSLQLDPLLAYQLNNSPVNALNIINSKGATSLTSKYFSKYEDTEHYPFTHHLIDLDLNKIHREMHNPHRFEEVAVAVVDFAMPEINGLEFCQGIKNPFIKKILLTGKADEKIAIHAFNEGIIDRFIMKSDAAVFEILNQAIAELQQKYFRQVEQVLSNALTVGSYAFLHDSLFASEIFKDICQKKEIVEYYLCGHPEGILLLDANAVCYFLIVLTEQDLKTHIEIAHDQGAPQELIRALESRRKIPYFWQTDGYYRPRCTDWESCLHPAEEFKGGHHYYYAVVKNPLSFKLGGVVSYNDFLEKLDQSRPELSNT